MKLLYTEHQNTREFQSDYVTRVLRKNILLLVLFPGQSISENQICTYLNASRTPVREAFIKLSNEGLLEIRPQQKTSVSLINIKKIKNGVFMRYAVEKEILIDICRINTDDLLEQLKTNISLQENKIFQNPEKFIELDNQFHRLIYKAVDKEGICNIIEQEQLSYERLRVLLYQKQSTYDIVIKQHLLLLDLIKQKDIVKLHELITLHIKKVFINYSSIIKENKNYIILE